LLIEAVLLGYGFYLLFFEANTFYEKIAALIIIALALIADNIDDIRREVEEIRESLPA